MLACQTPLRVSTFTVGLVTALGASATYGAVIGFAIRGPIRKHLHASPDEKLLTLILSPRRRPELTRLIT